MFDTAFDSANSDYTILENIAAVKNYGETEFSIVSMEVALSGDFSETRNVATVRDLRVQSHGNFHVIVPGAQFAPSGSANCVNDSVFLHQSGVGGWLRAERV